MNQDPKQSKSANNSIPEGLRVVRECPLCKKDYDLNDTSVIKEKKGAHLVHATCPHCKSAVLSVVTVTQLGMGAVGVMTDLDVEDVERLHSKESISEDELLNFHTFIRKKHTALIDSFTN